MFSFIPVVSVTEEEAAEVEAEVSLDVEKGVETVVEASTVDEIVEDELGVTVEVETLPTPSISSALLIALSKGQSPSPHRPWKSSVSILQTMILLMPKLLAYSTFLVMESTSS